MVSFTCSRCHDVVKKPKVLSHAQSCGGSATSYSCVDCMQVFDLEAVKAHNSCISEEEKYQGRWKANKGNASRANTKAAAPIEDSDNEDEEAKLRKEKELLQRRVRPPSKNFLASLDSDSEGDDWLSAGDKSDTKTLGKNGNGKADRNVKEPASLKRPRTDPSHDSASNTEKDEEREEEREMQRRRHAPLMLPPSTADMDSGNGKPRKSNGNGGVRAEKDSVVVESFSLGSQAEVQEIIREILLSVSSSAEEEEDGNGGRAARKRSAGGRCAMPEKALTKELVERYKKRIAKYLRPSVEAVVAASDGELSFDNEGNIVC